LFTPILLVALAAAPGPIKLAAPGFTVVNLEKNLGAFYSEHLAQELTHRGLRVVTDREIQTVLGFERQKALVGCSEQSSSCMAELAGALGVDGLVLGDLAKLGNTYQLNVKVVGAGAGELLAAHSSKSTSDEKLLDALEKAADEIAKALTAKLRPEVVKAEEEARRQERLAAASSLRKWSLLPAAVGVASAAAGGVLLVRAADTHRRLTSPTAPALELSNAQRLAASGKRAQLWGAVGLGVGAAALTVAGVMFFQGAPPESAPAVAFTPNGASIGWAGVWP
jgi:hypothetical protein